MNDDDDELCNLGPGIGSLVQLSAKGPNDEFINKGGSTDLFNKRFYQHTPFLVTNEQFDLSVSFGSQYQTDIPMMGDFIKDIFIKFQLPTLNLSYIAWKSNLSQRIITEFNITVNNQNVFFQDNIYAAIQNYLDGNWTDSEIDFKINATERNGTFFCYLQIPLWNKKNSRQFFPIGSL